MADLITNNLIGYMLWHPLLDVNHFINYFIGLLDYMNLPLQQNLKKLMIKHGNMSVSDLAKATGLPQPTLYQLCTGATENPREKTRIVLADYFSITVNQLLGKEPLPTHLPEKTKTQLEINTAPLLNWEDLHDWPHPIHDAHKQEIFLDNTSSKTTFAVKMHDHSMEPIFPSGCLLIFDTEKTARHNDCAIIFNQALNQFIFKKISTENNRTFVHSINPAFSEKIELTQNDSILATLLEARLVF